MKNKHNGDITINEQSKKGKTKSLKTILAGVFAVIFCPCHLPLLLPLLAGTAFGSVLSQYTGVVIAVMVVIFGMSVWYLLRKLSANEKN